LVSKEFPIYRITDPRLTPAFLQVLLRSRYYQRAFRAITTGHSNRRRTQVTDFERLEIPFPPDPDEQHRLVAGIVTARAQQRNAITRLGQEYSAFSNLIDHRGTEELPEVSDEGGTDGTHPG
jgi:type I restriction enzyme M protein